MGVPRTYLFTPPEGEANPYGVGMSHVDFIKKLKLCNKRITVPTPDQWEANYYPGREMGITTVWLGAPPPGKGKKIAGITLGWVPEWTVLTVDGSVKQKGWRAILRKCVMARAFTQAKAERVFNTNMEVSGRSNLCDDCARCGLRKRATCASHLCDMHERVRLSVAAHVEWKKEQKWLSSPSVKTRRKVNAFRLMPSLRWSVSKQKAALSTALAKSSSGAGQPSR